MKRIYKILAATVALLSLPLLVWAVQITVPSAPGAGYCLKSIANGTYTALVLNCSSGGSGASSTLLTTDQSLFAGASTTFIGNFNMAGSYNSTVNMNGTLNIGNTVPLQFNGFGTGFARIQTSTSSNDIEQWQLINTNTGTSATGCIFFGNDKTIYNSIGAASAFYGGICQAGSNYNIPGFNGIKAGGIGVFSTDGPLTIGSGSSNAASSSIYFQSGSGLDASYDMVLTGKTAFLGLSTSTPYAKLSVHANNGDTETQLFAVGSSTATATTTLFTIDNKGTASSTNLVVSGNASSTQYFGGLLKTCNAGSNALTWSAGLFGCNVISGSGTVNSGTQGQAAFYNTSTNAVSGTSSIFISTASNVGINTITPQTSLDVQGIASSTTFYASNGSASNPSHAFSLKTNTGIYNSAGDLAVTVNGTQRGEFYGNGLEILANGAINQAALSIGSTLGLGLYAPAANTLGFIANSVDVGRFDSTGRFGVGTTSPYAKLSVFALPGDTNTTLFAVGSSTVTASTTLFSIDNMGTASTTKLIAGTAGINTVDVSRGPLSVNTTSNTSTGGFAVFNSAGSMRFWEDANGIGRIDAGANGTGQLDFNTGGGNVGFGSSTPYASLSVSNFPATTNKYLFAVGSSTATATSTLFAIDNQGTASTTALVISNISGTQCLHTTGNGTVAGTGSDCGAGGSGASSTLLTDRNIFTASTTIFNVQNNSLQVFGTSTLGQATSTTLSTGILTVTSTTASSTFSNGIILSGGCLQFQGSCLAQEQNFKTAVEWASAAALPANIYANGTSGRGATLTGAGVGGLTVDGNSVITNDRVLVKNEATAANNGIYTVTVPGSGILAYVLTRSSDFDQSNEILPGDATFVVGGATLATTTWAFTGTTTVTVGTTAINFAQIGSGSGGGVTSVTATSPFASSGGTTPVISQLRTFDAADGGTGFNSYTPGDMLYAATSTGFAKIASSTNGSIFWINPNGAPAWTTTGNAFSTSSALAFLSVNQGNAFSTTSANAWATAGGYLTGNQNITLSGDITGSGATAITTTYNGTVPVNKGGTNITSYTPGDILYASTANILTKLGSSTASNILQISPTTGAPAWTNQATTSTFFATTASTTFLNSQNATSTTFASTVFCFTGDICRTTWPSASVSGGAPDMLTSWVNSTTLTSTSSPVIGSYYASSTTATSTNAGVLSVSGNTRPPGNAWFEVGTSTSNLFVDKQSGWVGVGTSTPESALSVTGNVVVRGLLYAVESILATSSNMTIDMGTSATSATSSSAVIRIGSSAMTVNFTGGFPGQTFALNICHPATGTAGVITWTGILWPSGVVPNFTTTANHCDLETLRLTNGSSTMIREGGAVVNY